MKSNTVIKMKNDMDFGRIDNLNRGERNPRKTKCTREMITDIEDLSSEVAKSLMYVGMSRARYGLILLISETMHDQYYDILKNKLT